MILSSAYISYDSVGVEITGLDGSHAKKRYFDWYKNGAFVETTETEPYAEYVGYDYTGLREAATYRLKAKVYGYRSNGTIEYSKWTNEISVTTHSRVYAEPNAVIKESSCTKNSISVYIDRANMHTSFTRKFTITCRPSDNTSHVIEKRTGTIQAGDTSSSVVTFSGLTEGKQYSIWADIGVSGNPDIIDRSLRGITVSTLSRIYTEPEAEILKYSSSSRSVSVYIGNAYMHTAYQRGFTITCEQTGVSKYGSIAAGSGNTTSSPVEFTDLEPNKTYTFSGSIYIDNENFMSRAIPGIDITTVPQEVAELNARLNLSFRTKDSISVFVDRMNLQSDLNRHLEFKCFHWNGAQVGGVITKDVSPGGTETDTVTFAGLEKKNSYKIQVTISILWTDKFEPRSFYGVYETTDNIAPKFEWINHSSTAEKGDPFDVTARDWNALTESINSVRVCCGDSQVLFTQVSRGMPFTKEIYNEVVRAIQGIKGGGVYGGNLSTVNQSGTAITSAHINLLRSELNQVFYPGDG